MSALLVVFVAFVVRSWLGWAHVDYDYGREMVVPWRILLGDVLYRDVRYAYGPLTPHLHAAGYALFGVHLNVLYASGLLFTAGIVLALYWVARALTSVPVAWAASVLVAADLMFFPGAPGQFSYVFPYSFGALHGLFFVCVALGAALRVLRNPTGRGCATVGVAVGLALLTKQEAGAVGLGMLSVTSVALWMQSRARRRILASLIVPALAVPAVGYGILSLYVDPDVIVTKGMFDAVYFGWPISWSIMGFPANPGVGDVVRSLAAQHRASGPAYLLAALLIAAACLVAGRFRSGRESAKGIPWMALLAGALIAAAFLSWAGGPLVAQRWLRPRYGVLPGVLLAWLVVETIVLGRAIAGGVRPQVSNLQRWLAVSVALAMLGRVPAALVPHVYANFALPVALVLMVILMADRLPRGLGAWVGDPRAPRLVALSLVLGLAFAMGAVRWQVWAGRDTLLSTPRGDLWLSRRDPYLAMYRDGLERIRQKTKPEDSVVAIPAGPAFNFLSGRGNRLYETGLIARLKTGAEERAYIEDLERENPAMIFLSNRPQPEYGRIALGVDHGHRVRDWIERGYHPEGTVGGTVRGEVWRRMPRWDVPPGVDAELALPYRRVRGRDLVLDVYRPSVKAGPLPVLLFFHGGGWKVGTRRSALPYDGRPYWAHTPDGRWPSLLPYLESGMAIVAPAYRLSGEASAPAAVEDARAALAWVRETGSAHGLDPSRIVLVGVSAGGHLALVLGATAEDTSGVLGVIDLYGPTDVPDLLQGPNRRAWAVEWIGDGAEAMERARAVSPLTHVSAEMPPTLIVHSDVDAVVPYGHAQALEAALAHAGVPVTLLTIPDGVHGFFSEEQLRVLEREIREFLVRIGAE